MNKVFLTMNVSAAVRAAVETLAAQVVWDSRELLGNAASAIGLGQVPWCSNQVIFVTNTPRVCFPVERVLEVNEAGQVTAQLRRRDYGDMRMHTPLTPGVVLGTLSVARPMVDCPHCDSLQNAETGTHCDACEGTAQVPGPLLLTSEL